MLNAEMYMSTEKSIPDTVTTDQTIGRVKPVYMESVYNEIRP